MWVQWWSCGDGSVTRFSWPITTTPQMRRHTTWWFAIDRSTYFRSSLVFWHKYFTDANNSQGNVATHLRCGNVAGCLLTTLLQIYCWVCMQKKFENQTLFGEVTGKNVVYSLIVRTTAAYDSRRTSGVDRHFCSPFTGSKTPWPKHEATAIGGYSVHQDFLDVFVNVSQLTRHVWAPGL